jgi:iron complex outermembrane receptor protein
MVKQPFYLLVPLPNPSAPGGLTNTIIDSGRGNPALDAERAKSFTAGLDFRPNVKNRLVLSVTYFRTRFLDRISTPPLVGGLGAAFIQPYDTSFFLNQAPSAQEVSQVFQTGPLNNPLNIQPGQVGAILDNKIRNLVETLETGIQASVSKDFPVGPYTLNVSGNLVHLIDNEFTPAAGTATVTLINNVSQPVDLRANGSITFFDRTFSFSAILYYVDSYKNKLVNPISKVSSYTTMDLSLRKSFGRLDLGASILNALDRRPPHIDVTPQSQFNTGYDAANASAVGRTIAVFARIRI